MVGEKKKISVVLGTQINYKDPPFGKKVSDKVRATAMRLEILASHAAGIKTGSRDTCFDWRVK